MFPFFPSPLKDPQVQGQQARPTSAQNQEGNPFLLNNIHRIPSQFQNPQMPPFNNQSMIMPIPSSSIGYRPNPMNPLQSSIASIQPQNGNPFFNQNPQTLNQMPGIPFPSQICNVSQVLNQIGLQQLCGQLAANNQMQNLNQLYNFSQGGNLWPQNMTKNLNQIMGFQGQYGPPNLMPRQNQIQQSAATGFRDAFSSTSNQSGSSNASLPEVPTSIQPGACSVNVSQAGANESAHDGFRTSGNFQRNHRGSFNRNNSLGKMQRSNHHMERGNGNNNMYRKKWERGPPEGKMRHSQFTKHRNNDPDERCKKKSTASTYTEEEVRMWREARRKNFPSSTNVQKKYEKVNANSKEVNEDEKLRRQQLKEVLEKQVELGFEAAEVPSSYLVERDQEMPSRDRKRDWDSDIRRTKRQRPRKGPRPPLPPPPPNLSLLRKLLSSEMKRDASHLLQVFRFMTLNSFFDFWPEKPLKYAHLTCNGVDLQEGDEKTKTGVGETSEDGDCVTDGEGDGIEDGHENEEG